MTQWTLNGAVIDPRGFTVGETQYPATAPDCMSDDERAALGIAPYVPPPPPPKTPAQLRQEAKFARDQAVAAITVEVDGMVFDGDEISQTRMTRAILGLQAAGVPTIQWTLADNTQATVTVSELTQALILAGQRQAELWPLT